MPNQILKGSVRYCTKNKLFFLVVFIQFFIFECIMDEVGGIMKTTSLFVLLVVLGYGLKVTEDVIHGGTGLPKITLEELIDFGIRGIIVYIFYLTIQTFLLGMVSMNLNFPTLDLEEMILEIPETVKLFYTHDPVSFILFIALGILVFYCTVFFMEIALARLANGRRLLCAFDFMGIKRTIDVIGWKVYAWDYTKIVLAAVILVAINHMFSRYGIIGITIGVITDMLLFRVEYRGIGNIYRDYLEKKSNSP